MLKTLLNQVKQFKTASILTPIFTSLEVVMGVLIPYVTSWIIDRGIMAGDVRKVVFYGVIMLILAFVSLAFGILSGRFSPEGILHLQNARREHYEEAQDIANKTFESITAYANIPTKK